MGRLSFGQKILLCLASLCAVLAVEMKPQRAPAAEAKKVLDDHACYNKDCDTFGWKGITPKDSTSGQDAPYCTLEPLVKVYICAQNTGPVCPYKGTSSTQCTGVYADGGVAKKCYYSTYDCSP